MAEFFDFKQARISARALSMLASAANDLEKATGRWKMSEFIALQASEELFRIAFLFCAVGVPVESGLRGEALERLARILTISDLQRPLPGMEGRPKKRHTAAIQELFTKKNVDDLAGQLKSLRDAKVAENDDAWAGMRDAAGYSIAKVLAAAMRRAAWTAGQWDTKESSAGRRSISPTVKELKGEEPRGRDERSYLYVLATGGPKIYGDGRGVPAPATTRAVSESTELQRAQEEELPPADDFTTPLSGLAGLSTRPRLWDTTRSSRRARGLAGLGALGCCTSSRAFLAALKEMNRG